MVSMAQNYIVATALQSSSGMWQSGTGWTPHCQLETASSTVFPPHWSQPLGRLQQTASPHLLGQAHGWQHFHSDHNPPQSACQTISQDFHKDLYGQICFCPSLHRHCRIQAFWFLRDGFFWNLRSIPERISSSSSSSQRFLPISSKHRYLSLRSVSNSINTGRLGLTPKHGAYKKNARSPLLSRASASAADTIEVSETIEPNSRVNIMCSVSPPLCITYIWASFHAKRKICA